MMLSISDRVEVLPLDGGVLLAEWGGYQLVEGDMAACIITAVHEGHLSREEIAAHFSASHNEHEVNGIIDLMIRDGLLNEVSPLFSRATCRKWSRLGRPLDLIQKAVTERKIHLGQLGEDFKALAACFEAWGIETGMQDEETLTVISVASFFESGLEALNVNFWQQGGPWLLVSLPLRKMTLFVPGQTACFKCLRAAMLNIHPAAGNMKVAAGNDLETSLFLEAVGEAVLQWLVDEKHAGLEGYLWMQHQLHEPLERHAFFPRRHCEICGTEKKPSGFMSSLVESLETSGKRGNDDTSYNKYSRHISPVTGIFRAPCLLPVVDERLGYTAMVQHNLARPALDLQKLRINAQGCSIGKGVTKKDARASALFEGIERYSGIWRDEISIHWATYHELGDAAIDVNALLGYSHQQYEDRDAWNAKNCMPMLQTPVPFNPQEKVGWVEGYHLLREEKVFVPAGYCFYDYPERSGLHCDSNGCAAGQQYGDALLAGLFELIERDAIALWWYNKVRRPAILLNTFDNGCIQSQSAAYAALGRSLCTIDLTTDFGVPVVAVISRDDENTNDWVFGFGCHWDVASALQGALLEANQVLSAQHHAGEPVPVVDQPIPGDASWLLPDPFQAPRKPAVYTDEWPLLKTLVEKLAQQNLGVVVVDQTHPDIGLPVMRVIVPGLCHHWRRLGSQRLYTVPAKLGWTRQVLTEDSLNPATIIL